MQRAKEMRVAGCSSIRSVIRRTVLSAPGDGLPASVARPLWHASCPGSHVSFGLQKRNQRQSRRVDVLLRIKGELVPATFPISMFDLSRTGFAIISGTMFRAGDRLDVLLTGAKGSSVQVSAKAVHTRSLRGSPGRFVTGFEFVPGRDTGSIPEDAITQLIDAVTQTHGQRTRK